MKIKNYFKVFCSLFMFAGFFSCSNNETNENVAGQGTVMVDLSTNLSYSRSIDESVYKNVNNYKVSLYKGEEPVYEDVLYSALELTQKVDFDASYTITAHYGNDVAAGYDSLYVKGSQTFSVSQGDTEVVSVVCKPANAKMSVVYKGNDENDTFEDYFQDCAVSVKTEHMDEAWVLNKENVGQELYLRTGDSGTSATLSFSITDKDGEVVTVEGFETEKTITIEPACAYTITIKPTEQSIAGGKFGLTITVDDGVTEEDVTVNIPGEYIPS